MSETENKLDQLFMNLVLSLHSAAMQQMGKLKNPITDKVERNLGQAELSIDMLDMIKKKTEGNLSEEENKFLKQMLNELKMNFMDEKNKGEEKPPEEVSEDEEPEDEKTSSDVKPDEKDSENDKEEKSGEEE
ncbi:MAG: DUF1844 domain-containing protein [Candidatus Marinimicrobia bacterium]|nr:DUF1844 domain-containing protein [Candidatus Neomarinimicrobiota bacterium]